MTRTFLAQRQQLNSGGVVVRVHNVVSEQFGYVDENVAALPASEDQNNKPFPIDRTERTGIRNEQYFIHGLALG